MRKIVNLLFKQPRFLSFTQNTFVALTLCDTLMKVEGRLNDLGSDLSNYPHFEGRGAL